MKTIKYPIVFIIFLVILSCNKKLDVNPQNTITPDQIKTSDDVKALLFGGYSKLQDASAFGERFLLIPDLFASKNQIDFVGTFLPYTQIQLRTFVSTNSIASGIWINSYNIINIVNTVLDKSSLVDNAEKASVEGEALFIRALIYFELTGLYGKPFSDGKASTNLSVPLILQPTYQYDPSKNKPSRATIEDALKQIITDLKAAIQKLPEDNDNARATVYSAKSILSRVYLAMGDFKNAATQANDVINSGSFILSSTFDKAFNNTSNSTEDIFAIQQTSQSNSGTTNNGLTTLYAPQRTGRGDVQLDSSYLDNFGNGDFRKTFFTNGTSIAGFSGGYTNKWIMRYRAIPVIRLSELYLTRGEANFRSGVSVGTSTPLEDLNIVRKRSGASLLSTVTADDFVNERFRELAFEGDRFWTLKRLKMKVNNVDYDNNKLILPIPQSEIDANGNLIQN